MKKLINLQMYAEDTTTTDSTTSKGTTSSAPGTAEKDDVKKAVADTGKETQEPEKKYTDDDVDRIVKSRIAREREQAKKEKEEAEKLAEMNATQKAEYERDQLKKELAELKRKDALSEMTKVARKMLTDKDINIPDELLSMMVTTDAQETKIAVDSFAKLYKDAVDAAVKARLKGEPPRVGSGTSSPVSEIEKRIKKYQ
jgi:hypothetical protein